jgi:hypothetical protein
MCFSAEASFGVSVVLIPASVYCVKCAMEKNSALLCLAVVPAIFSLQQLAEGLVWIGLRQHDASLTRAASLAYLGFALAFWPFWIPFCACLLEPRGRRKCLLGGFTLLGLSGGLALLVPVMLHPELLVTLETHHSIDYDILRSPVFQWMPQVCWEMLYVALIAVPPLLSRTTGFLLFGVGVVLSAAVSHAFYWYASASVWCFFASMLSLQLCLAFRRVPVVGFATPETEGPAA